jgi:hypothetical protein
MNQKMRSRIHNKRYFLLWGIIASIAFFVYIFSPKLNYLSETKAQEENMPQDISDQLQKFGLFSKENTNTNQESPERTLKQFPQDIPKKQSKKIPTRKRPTTKK